MATQIFTLESHSWNKPNFIITDDETSQVVYTGDSHTFRPHIEFAAPGVPGVVGAVTFRKLGGLDMTLRTREFNISKKSFFSSKHIFVTAAGQTLTWKGGLANLQCVDAQNQLVVDMGRDGWTGKRIKIRVVRGVGDEVLLSAVALIELLRRQSRSSAGAAANANAATSASNAVGGSW